MNETGDTPDNDQPTKQSQLPVGRGCLISGTVVLLAICITFTIIGLKTLNTLKTIVTGIQIPFLEANIQETFQSTAFKAVGTEGGTLEVATATTTENFERKSEVSLFDRIMPLGATISEIQVPATYRYHIDLNESWQIKSHQNQCIVIAPDIRASLPVAFDTGKMKSKTASGWARWDKHQNLKLLEKSLTEKLAVNAVLPENIDQVRDKARLSIAKFVKTWLIHQSHWSDERFTEIIILFSDEVEKDPQLTERPLPPPTLRLKDTPRSSLPADPS